MFVQSKQLFPQREVLYSNCQYFWILIDAIQLKKYYLLSFDFKLILIYFRFYLSYFV